MNEAKMVWEYYVQSRKAEAYRKMIMSSLYHPPHIEIDQEKSKKNGLYLVHRFEGKPLLHDYIPNTMLGIEYLWGGPVQLETREVIAAPPTQAMRQLIPGVPTPQPTEKPKETEHKWQLVVYTMENRKLSKKIVKRPV